MATILVCGGTGFVGSAIVRKLTQQHTVKVFIRKAKRSSKNIPDVEYVTGNISSIPDLERAMKNCDMVINAAQFENAPFENPRKSLTYEKVDVEGTKNIVIVAKKMNIARILYISGAGVEEGKTENWFVAKLRAEKAIQNSGINYTIFRPSWIYGKNDRSLNRIIPMIRYSLVVVILGKGYRIQPIYIEDVADIVSKVVGLPQANNQIYELGGPESLTMKEISHTTAKILNRRKLYVYIPKFWGAILFSILEKIPGSIVTRSALDFITMNIVISEESQKKVEKDFQIHISPLEKALKNYL